MNLDKTISSFNNKAYSRTWKVSGHGIRRLDKILKLVGSNKRVLDVGCYDGTIAQLLQKNQNHVVGIDISANAIKLARRRGVEGYVCNLETEKIPRNIGKFDIIVAGEIIEHIFDPDSFIKKLHGLLRTNGSLILTTPNLAGLGSRLSLLLGQTPWMIENDILPGKSGHIRYFTITQLTSLLERNGFHVTDFTTDSVGIANTTIPYLGELLPVLGRILIVKASKK